MNEEDIKKVIREELANFIRSDRFTFYKLLQILDGRNVQVGLTTGTKIGTSTSQKLSVYGVTPVVQAAAIISPAGGATVDIPARLAISEILTALRNIGI